MAKCLKCNSELKNDIIGNLGKKGYMAHPGMVITKSIIDLFLGSKKKGPILKCSSCKNNYSVCPDCGNTIKIKVNSSSYGSGVKCSCGESFDIG